MHVTCTPVVTVVKENQIVHLRRAEGQSGCHPLPAEAGEAEAGEVEAARLRKELAVR